jgi:hypothetical protein
MTTIDDVLAELDLIIANCSEKNSRQGYFAALYRAMTNSVKQQIAKGYFEDAARMEKLDVIFASRYVDAWKRYQQSIPCSKSWQCAFDACTNKGLIVLQHLILGINTHINLDLCIAAAETCPGESIFSLQQDFEKINQLIASLTDTVQQRLEKIWWPMKLLKRISNGREKAVINFSINNARKASWSNAVVLAGFKGDAAHNYTNGLDKTVTAIARKIIEPGALTRLMLLPVSWLEYRDVRKIIAVLNEPLAG